MKYWKELLVAVTTGWTLSSCQDELTTGGHGQNAEFCLQGNDVDMATTRAANEHFSPGTQYTIYTLDSKNGWGISVIGNPLVEGDDQLLAKLPADGGQNRFRFETGVTELSFYALTDGTENAPELNADKDTPPTYTHTRAQGANAQQEDAANTSISIKDAPLSDLRRAVLLNQTQNDVTNGKFVLPFKHTLSQLRYEVMRQTKTEDDPLEGATITKIEIQDYAEGALDLKTGEYSFGENVGEESKKTYTIYEASSEEQGLELTGEATPLIQTENGIEPKSETSTGEELKTLIFPNESIKLTDEESNNEGTKLKKKALKIIVTVRKKAGTSSDGFQTCTVENYVTVSSTTSNSENNAGSSDNTGSETIVNNPFIFQSNHYYVLQIVVLNDDVRIIAIVPQKYDWIDEEVEPDMAQPIVFNNLMWADRNLGADIANPQTDQEWENSRGYYYQYGRSIPYTVEHNYQKDGFSGVQTNGVSKPNGASEANWPYPVLPGITSHEIAKANGYEPHNTRNSDISFDEISLTPGDGDNKKSRFILFGKNTFSRWDPTNNDGNCRTYWTNTENQPCPKGWRLPTINEYKTIFPTTENAGDVTFLKTGHSGRTIWSEVVEGDPEPGYKSLYVCYREPDKSYGVLYCIKYYKTDKAYRIRWTPTYVGSGLPDPDTSANTEGIGRGMLQISNHTSSRDDDISTDPDDPNYVLEKDWNHPTAEMYFPVVGYILSNADYNGEVCIVYSGCEVVMLSADMRATVRIKFAGDHWSRYIYTFIGNPDSYVENTQTYGDPPAYGYQARCVRDIEAKD